MPKASERIATSETSGVAQRERKALRSSVIGGPVGGASWRLDKGWGRTDGRVQRCEGGCGCGWGEGVRRGGVWAGGGGGGGVVGVRVGGGRGGGRVERGGGGGGGRGREERGGGGVGGGVGVGGGE